MQTPCAIKGSETAAQGWWMRNRTHGRSCSFRATGDPTARRIPIQAAICSLAAHGQAEELGIRSSAQSQLLLSLTLILTILSQYQHWEATCLSPTLFTLEQSFSPDF